MNIRERTNYFLQHAVKADSWRTLLSKVGIFLPVSRRRWDIAQKFEYHAWELPEVWEKSETHPSFINEETKSNFIINVAEQALGLKLGDLLSDKLVIDVACGPCSVIAAMEHPKSKYGVDPFPFPEWVLERYRSLNFQLIPSALERLQLNLNSETEEPVIIMYNALQHFESPYRALKKLSKIFPQHTLLVIEYLNTSADRAHPQILTTRRILRLIRFLKYETLNSVAVDAYLENLVQSGVNKPVRIGAFIARK
jgi:hypothetical protein